MYTSSVLTAVYWIWVIPLLIVGYYAGYGYIRKRSTSPRLALVSLWVSTAALLYIAFAFVNNLTLMQSPDRLPEYFENRTGTLTALKDAVFWPRMFHFITASVAVGGLFLASIRYYRAKKTADDATRSPESGLRIFAVATALQIAVGLWFFISLPDKIRGTFLGGNRLFTVVLAISVLLALSTVLSAFRGKLKATLFHFFPLVLLMVFNRFNLRSAYLADYFKPDSLKVNFQSGVLALFLVVLVLGVVAVVYMIRLVRRSLEEEVSP